MITWREAYPSVDIEQDLKRAASHLVSTGKPVIKYGQFIDNWLKKSQNFSSIRSIPNRNEPGPGKKLCAYCEKQGTGSVGGIWHCNEHIYDAMDQKPIPRMRDVTAKPVSGS
jgi:hypothetical protein